MNPLNLNTTDLILLAIAGYFAVTTLVRLMLNERNRLAQELDAQVQAEQRKAASEKARNKRAA